MEWFKRDKYIYIVKKYGILDGQTKVEYAFTNLKVATKYYDKLMANNNHLNKVEIFSIVRKNKWKSDFILKKRLKKKLKQKAKRTLKNINSFFLEREKEIEKLDRKIAEGNKLANER